MAVVFISYKSESSLDLVRDTLCPALEAAGFSCWYANRDSRPGAFGGQINQAIGKCRIFLLVLEQTALHSAHIKNETALAFRRYERDEPITLIPFRVGLCNLEDDADLDYYLIRQQIVDGCPPDTPHIRNLTEQISMILNTPQDIYSGKEDY